MVRHARRAPVTGGRHDLVRPGGRRPTAARRPGSVPGRHAAGRVRRDPDRPHPPSSRGTADPCASVPAGAQAGAVRPGAGLGGRRALRHLPAPAAGCSAASGQRRAAPGVRGAADGGALPGRPSALGVLGGRGGRGRQGGAGAQGQPRGRRRGGHPRRRVLDVRPRAADPGGPVGAVVRHAGPGRAADARDGCVPAVAAAGPSASGTSAGRWPGPPRCPVGSRRWSGPGGPFLHPRRCCPSHGRSDPGATSPGCGSSCPTSSG